MDPDKRKRLLRVLDDTPSTVTALSRKLDWEEQTVEAGLRALQADKLAIDWGTVWATTWRAKMQLSPAFFRVWIPASAGLGVGATALALLLNGPATLPVWVAPLFMIVAVLALAYGLVPVVSGEPIDR